MGDFLVVSIVASVILTIVLNVVLRFRRHDPERWFPSEPDNRQPVPSPDGGGRHDHGAENGFAGPRIRVYFPWKAMLAISIGLTVLLNLVALLAR